METFSRTAVYPPRFSISLLQSRRVGSSQRRPGAGRPYSQRRPALAVLTRPGHSLRRYSEGCSCAEDGGAVPGNTEAAAAVQPTCTLSPTCGTKPSSRLGIWAITRSASDRRT
jgi:hypothetical protein